MISVRIVETPGLGDRTYLVTDGAVAVVIDPQRDFDRVLDVAGDVPITHVFETHIHNDYVTGGLALAHHCGATYVLNADDPVRFERYGIRDGERIATGSFTVTAIHTPGHTPTHLSYVVAVGDEQIAVFTGGSLLFGAMGRTDLVDPARTDELTRAQYRSAHRLADQLPDATEVYPTHGFGSFCSATETKGTQSTIAQEKRQNNALTTTEDAFVTELTAGLTAYPRYYAQMGPLNLAGPGEADLSMPQPVDPHVLQHRLEHGDWVVDLRSRRAYAAGHVPGTVSIELADPFATYLGWTVPWGAPLTLIGDTAEQVSDARRQLVRIGIDQLDGAAVGEPHHLTPDGTVTTYRRATFAELAAERSHRPHDIVVLDVRRADEWDSGHLDGAVHIPFYELRGREHEVRDGEVWVHCVSGYRASIGASLMDRAGRAVVHIDDDWDHAADAGLDIVAD
ncbi:MBL fold metallo-hydrolase [Desertimonas flava]|jgi:glyoxylase-like metal-dependent hydrolase (beta-lactamase superfamily II)/rhodanese-related sulfurtransferase|uniref:MBL fold metallo-hydrolase n=1 Tax=Desertimonas flava TaxID=2064846 RepID=UPI000E34B3EC|nr:MBL fold metallo-hydrolase [Desertimonas flava]